MALLFQSNPDQWDLRKYLNPGGRASWFVNRYLNHMKPGVLVLLWEAQGSESPAVRGLYGWGILLSEPTRDERGRLRIPLIYVERWVSANDAKENVPDSRHVAAISAGEVLSLSAWQNHPLAKMPIGTNFVVTQDQMQALNSIVISRYPRSAFPRAVELEQAEQPLSLSQFEKLRIEEAGDGKK